MNEAAHQFVTGMLGLLSLLLTAFAAVLWSNFKDVQAGLKALQAQNEGQERELATLKANTIAHDSTFDRLARAVEKLDEKLDDLSKYLRRGYTPQPFPKVGKE